MPYAHTQHIKVPKCFYSYIQYGCGIQSEAWCSLINDITISHWLGSTPQNPKIHPRCCAEVYGRKGGPICPYTAFKVPKCFSYTSNMDVGSSLKPGVASLMTLQHHTGSGLPPKPPKSTPDVQRCMGVRWPHSMPIHTAYQGAKMLFIHPICMWDPV
jgi:hypothetical protein